MDDLAQWLDAGYPTAYRTVRMILHSPADAEDAVQEAFLRVWRFRNALPAGPARRAWVYRVVVDACLSRLRADAHRPKRADDEILPDQPGAARDPAAAAESPALTDAVTAALDALPEQLRIPVVLRYYTGLDEREVAAAIRRRAGTVRARLVQARARLAADAQLCEWMALEEAR